MKHAFLIIAHNEFQLLQRLIDSLDNEDCDIYIHIDKKNKEKPKLSTDKSNLYVVSEISVYWGDYSMVETEFYLMRQSILKKYDYYHLISGVDMPIKSIKYILNFFENNSGKIFIDSYKYPSGELEKKNQFWHIFPHFFSNQPHKFVIPHILRTTFLFIQQVLNIKRNKDLELKKGSQWFSITHDVAKFLLTKEHEIKKRFTHTFCPDEVAIHTMIFHSPYRERAFIDEWNGIGNLRYIDWKTTGNVKTLTMNDFETLMDTDALFARKFSEKNIDVVDAIIKAISE